MVSLKRAPSTATLLSVMAERMKAINPSVQVHVRASDRLLVLPMNATQKPVPLPVAAEEGKT